MKHNLEHKASDENKQFLQSLTQSREYSDIKICSSYKINGTHLKYLNTISVTGNLISSNDSMVMRVGPGVDNQFSHGSDTSTERFKMTKTFT